MTRNEIEDRLQDLVEEKRELERALKSTKGRKLATCIGNCYGKGCGKRSQIRTLTAITPWWYHEPHGCTEGDYWSPSSEVQWDCLKCGHRNRAYKSSYGGESPHIYDLREFFGRQVASHDERGHPPKPDEP